MQAGVGPQKKNKGKDLLLTLRLCGDEGLLSDRIRGWSLKDLSNEVTVKEQYSRVGGGGTHCLRACEDVSATIY